MQLVGCTSELMRRAASNEASGKHRADARKNDLGWVHWQLTRGT